jgi:hypothetical protein
MYNIVHDLLLNVHREEKIARANTAAIIVEEKVEKQIGCSLDEQHGDPGIVETEAAKYTYGEVVLKENPLKTVHEIRCPKCHLPRLLHPTDGNGAKRPEPGVEYCKKRPFIEKPYHDIYGQTFVPEGPGRGKKKKDMINPLLQTTKEGTPSGSQESPGASPPPNEGPAKPIPFPHAKCHNCNTFLPIKRMNNHMVKCIGGGGRDSSRTALLKIQNGNSNGNGQNGTTPPGSRNGTPVPGAGNSKGKTSPNKREAGDDFDSDSSPQKKKKIKLKTTTTKLKAPKMMKSASQMSASNLSFEQKVPDSEGDDDDGDDDNDGDFGTVVVEPKKKLKPVVKKPKEVGSRKRWVNGIGKGGVKPNLPPIEVAKIKVKKAEGDMESESSQTLSSPN